MENEILTKAKIEAEKWLAVSDFSRKHDKQVVLEELSKRTFEGRPVVVRVIEAPTEATKALREACEEAVGGPLTPTMEAELAKAHLCVWDYYLMAFYESAFQASGLKHEFLEQSLFKAFENGMGFLINFGSVIVGVMLPVEAHRDEENRIHNASGPAIVWGDTEEYWWRGVRVEKDWIMNPQGVDPGQVLKDGNVERRRAGAEIIGWTRILDKLNAKVIDADKDPMVGVLVSVDLPDAPNSKFIRVMCGTGREFALPVPADVQTAMGAQLWMWRFEDTEVNRLLVRAAMVNRT